MTSQVAMVADIRNANAPSKLCERVAAFQRMADTAPAMLWVTDATGARTFLTVAGMSFTGLTPATAFGTWLAYDDTPRKIALMRATCHRANEQQEAIQFDYRIRRVDGNTAGSCQRRARTFQRSVRLSAISAHWLTFMNGNLPNKNSSPFMKPSISMPLNSNARVSARTAQLQAAKDRVEAILNNSPDAMLLLFTAI